MLAVLGLLGYFIYQRGATSVQAKWDAQESERKGAEAEANARNLADTIARQQKVAAAEATAAQAATELAAYRHTHPLTLLSCQLHAKASGDPAHPGQGAGDGTAAPGTGSGGVLQPPAAGDIGDQLDALMADADRINSAYRVCLATRPGAH